MLPGLDLFKRIPVTRFRGGTGFSSRYGQMLTFIIVGLAIFLLIFFSMDMIQKNNPIFTRIDSRTSEPLELTNTSFPFAFGLRMANGTFFQDERIYNVKATTSRTNKVIKFTSCKPEFFPIYYNQSIEPAIFCLSPVQTDVSKVLINFGDHININFLKCNNSTSNGTCLPQDVIDKTIEGGRLAIFYNDVIFDPINYGNPLGFNPTAFNPSLMSGLIKETTFLLSKSNYVFDDGWMLKDTHQVSKLTINTIVQYFEDFSAIPGAFKQISLRNSGITTTNKREYDKLPNILAQWDAIFALLILFGKMLTDSFTTFKAHEALINEMFSYDQTFNRFHICTPPPENKKAEIKEDFSLTPAIAWKALDPDKSQETGIESKEDIKDTFTGLGNQYDQREQNETKEISCLPNNRPITPEKITRQENRILTVSDYASNDHIGTLNSLTTRIPVLTRHNKSFAEEKFDLDVIASISGLKIEPPDLNSSAAKLNVNLNEIINENSQLDTESKPLETMQNAYENFEKSPFYNLFGIKKPKIVQKNYDLEYKPLDIGLLTWMFSRCRKTEEYKTFLHREEIIVSQFDFENLVKRFIEIDTLKYILLSSDQNALFEDCSKGLLKMKLKEMARESFKRQSIRIVPMVTDSRETAYRNLVGIENKDFPTHKMLRLIDNLMKK